MEYLLNESGLHIGKRTYIGECIDDDIFNIGLSKFNIKIKHFKNNKKIITYCSKPIFKIPGINKSNTKPIKILTRYYDDCQYREERVDNINRAKNRLKEIVLLNDFDYFVTFTFNLKKLDSTDIRLVIKKTQTYLKNAVQRSAIKYVLVPEFHKDGEKVHMHALISGNLNVTPSGVYKVKGFKKPMRLSTIKKKRLTSDIIGEVYNVTNWKYGFSTAILTYGSSQALSSYVTKYLTKEQKKIFGKSYWCSKNLNLYPVVELCNTYERFEDIPGKEYWHSNLQASFKYCNRLGDSDDDYSTPASSSSDI